MSPYERYLQNPTYADDVLWTVQQSSVKHVPSHVLNAHWSSDDAFELLEHLAVEHHIVPQPLAPFVDDCIKRGRSFLCFLHPQTLFLEPSLAAWVYARLGSGIPDAEVLQLLLYLSSNAESHHFAHYIRKYLVDAFASTICVSVCGSGCICKLCAHYLDDKHADLLCPCTLESMLMYRGTLTRTHALSMLGYLPLSVHVKVLHALVWCATCNIGMAMQHVQTLSSSSYAPALADSIQHFPHRCYVDRLHIAVLRRMIPYLVCHEAVHSLVRLFNDSEDLALQHGVVTALIANNMNVCPIAAVPPEQPCCVHDAIFFMLYHRKVPPSCAFLDAALEDRVAAKAVAALCNTTDGLPLQVQYARNWKRRKTALWGLLHARMRMFQHLRGMEFAWRMVFSFL